MKTGKKFSVILGILTLSVLSATAYAEWTIEASGYLAKRAAGATVPLVSMYPHSGAGDVFNSDDVALDKWAPSFKLSIGGSWGLMGFEIRGVLFGKLSNSGTHGSGSSWEELIIETKPVTYYGLSPHNLFTLDHESTFFGIEANLTFDLSPAVRLFAGPRYMNLGEKMIMTGIWPGGTEIDAWDVGNKLFGAQAGIRARLAVPMGLSGSAFNFTVRAAFGLFSNSAEVDFSVFDYAKDAQAAESKMTPVLDAGLAFGFGIGAHFELFAGYDLLWVGSTAKAVDQVGATSSFNPDHVTSTVAFKPLVIHGLKAGLAVHI